MRAGYHSGNVLQCPVPVKLAVYQQFLSHGKSDLHKGLLTATVQRPLGSYCVLTVDNIYQGLLCLQNFLHPSTHI